ncbi:MAG: molybdopterin-dependent oxidoreductase [Rhodoferax sp.]|nr:molybdopterin-dependent oxidoreductase [Rhodoferax sp.]
MKSFTATHWGIYEVVHEGGETVGLKAFDRDPDPSPIGLSMLDAIKGPLRVRAPSVRRSWLQAQRARRAGGAAPTQPIGAQEGAADLRGQEAFVEVSWEEALDLVADTIGQVVRTHGNASVFGGSYGWSSAGRFHHAQSQVHRFLNAVGGYVRHNDSYSLGAARVLMPHVVAPMEELMAEHTSWDVLEQHCELFVALGGVPRKNAQVSAGGPGEHNVRRSLAQMQQAGVRFVNISPDAADLETGAEHEWIPVRPSSDTALLLALAYVLYTEGLHDKVFLERYCVGFERVVPYLLGDTDGQPKTPQWAEAHTGVPAERIATLAREMASSRTMLTVAWSLQRAHHGEQPYWMVVTLAAMLGQIGLPGGGFGVGYGATNMMGNAVARFPGPTLPQGQNKVSAFIPVARFVDMLENPGGDFTYNGKTHQYPDIELVYWAGGNPFHHHQDLNRMTRAWRKPGAVIVHEQFWTATAKMADVVLPATTMLERDDIGYSTRERFMVAMKRAIDPLAMARDDYDIFADLATRLGAGEVYTEGRTSHQWLREMYTQSRARADHVGVVLPPFDDFWEHGLVDLAPIPSPVVMLEKFRADPQAHRLATPSGRIELYSETIAGFNYDDCAGHAQWYEPVEWLGSTKAQSFPLHLLSDQPFTKLHSQFDHAAYSRDNKINGREPIVLNPQDAQARGIADGDLVRVHNSRGACLAAARVSDRLRPGVVKLSTGAWFDPQSWHTADSLEKHGNPNVLTLDVGASSLSQGCMAQTCLVEVERFEHAVPELTAFDLPTFVAG